MYHLLVPWLGVYFFFEFLNIYFDFVPQTRCFFFILLFLYRQKIFSKLKLNTHRSREIKNHIIKNLKRYPVKRLLFLQQKWNFCFKINAAGKKKLTLQEGYWDFKKHKLKFATDNGCFFKKIVSFEKKRNQTLLQGVFAWKQKSETNWNWN